MVAIVTSTVIGIAALFSGECLAFGPSSTAPAVIRRRDGGRRTPRHLAATTSPDAVDDDIDDKDDDAGASMGRAGGGGGSSIEETVAEKLRRRASELRAEARAAEMVLRGGGGSSATTTATRPSSSSSSSSSSSDAGGRTEREKRVRYTELGGSCWEMTYRFANEPESAEEDDDAGKKKGPDRRTYGGKVRIRFRPDGYSDILPPVVVDNDDVIVIVDRRVATFEKVWGWDLEAASSSSGGPSGDGGGGGDPSSPESSDFLLFSADVRLPPPISAVEKFYFQASVVVSPADKMGGGGLSLNDGTVTVKRDVGAPGGWWGAFRGGGGILARFRLVGEFRCLPVEAIIPEP